MIDDAASSAESLADYDFSLPAELIAQRPSRRRRDSRLLYLETAGAAPDDRGFFSLVDLVEAGDLLVFNDTRVIPARLIGQKATGGEVEILLERILDEKTAWVQIRANRPLRIGKPILVPGAELTVEAREAGFYRLRIEHGPEMMALFEKSGSVPLPPYIDRPADSDDQDRYQTVYARSPGAVAAPTAGLHFDSAMLEELRRKRIKLGFLTLHVGAGTFQPIRSEAVSEHRMHAERVAVSDSLVTQIEAAKSAQHRVIAVGTTVVRALETAALSGRLSPYDGESRLFIRPGHPFRVVDAILTNFHLPRSTLLLLMAAFMGREPLLSAYRHAVRERYRFYSYGDAMFVGRGKEKREF